MHFSNNNLIIIGLILIAIYYLFSRESFGPSCKENSSNSTWELLDNKLCGLNCRNPTEQEIKEKKCNQPQPKPFIDTNCQNNNRRQNNRRQNNRRQNNGCTIDNMKIVKCCTDFASAI